MCKTIVVKCDICGALSAVLNLRERLTKHEEEAISAFVLCVHEQAEHGYFRIKKSRKNSRKRAA